jgi:NADH-quinone oxidoreductase subunit E
VVQIEKDYYEDLDAASMEAILNALRRGESPKPGPQNGRHSSEPIGGALTLTEHAQSRGGEG